MELLQNTLVFVLSIIVVFLLVTLTATFHWESVEDWAVQYAPLISGLILLLGALLAYLSALRNIHNTQDIEDKRIERDLNAKRLYFSSTLESLTLNITDQNNILSKIATKSLISKSPNPKFSKFAYIDTRKYLEDIKDQSDKANKLIVEEKEVSFTIPARAIQTLTY